MRYGLLIVTSFFVSIGVSCSTVSPTAPQKPTTRVVELIQEFKPPVKTGKVDLLIPLAIHENGYQKVLSETYQSNADWVKKEDIAFNENKEQVRVLHAHWSQAKKPSLQLRQIFLLHDRNGGLDEKQLDPYYLQPTDHVQTDGIVKKTALKITADLADSDQKAKAIFDWVVENTFRDPKIHGCGLGDVKSMLTSGNLGGKCADLNSLFVGLARASGVPAREVWGLRVSPSLRSPSLGKTGDVSRGQHCRAEYYSTKRKAWFPADPADVRKVMLEEKLTLDSPRVAELRRLFFGTWEGNWVAFNHGRDLRLSGGEKLNFLLYPQLIANRSIINGIDPEEVGYTFTSKIVEQNTGQPSPAAQ